MENKKPNTSFFHSSSLGGLIAGGILSMATLLTHVTRSNEPSFILSLLSIIIIITGLLIAPTFIARKFSQRNMLTGLSFARAFAHSYYVYMFAAILWGFVTSMCYNHDLDFYVTQLIDVYSSLGMDTTTSEFKELESNFTTLVQPLTMTCSFCITMSFFSLIPSAIIASFTKREATI